jgi:hypothetical protein
MLLHLSEFPFILRLIIFNCTYTHPSTSRHLGCFHILAIMTNAAVKWVCKYLFKILLTVFFGIYPEVELWHHLLTQSSCYLGLLTLVSVFFSVIALL